MAHGFIEEVKNTVSSTLPTSSGIVGEVIKIIYDQSSSAADLSEIIERDPPLTADIIKVANSAYYGASKKINSIKRSVVTLGFDTIKELVTTVTTVRYLFSSKIASEIDRSGLWLHSVGVAKAAQLISLKLNLERPDVVYTVGLLHDIGKILLALSFPEHYNSVVKLAAEKKCRIILAEHKLLNTDHCMIGKILCDIWGLPQEISSSIFYHHEPLINNESSQLLTRLVNLGDYMCRKAGIGNPGDETVSEPSSAVLHTLGNKPDKINETFNAIYNEFLKSREEIEGFYSGLK